MPIFARSRVYHVIDRVLNASLKLTLTLALTLTLTHKYSVNIPLLSHNYPVEYIEVSPCIFYLRQIQVSIEDPVDPPPPLIHTRILPPPPPLPIKYEVSAGTSLPEVFFDFWKAVSAVVDEHRATGEDRSLHKVVMFVAPFCAVSFILFFYDQLYCRF